MKIETLSKKLGGRLWKRHGFERIYLRRGHTTNKMSTSTFVQWDDVEKEWTVKCKIVCPSQPSAWIMAEEKKVIDQVKKEIKQICESQE